MISWFRRGKKAIVVELPVPLINALETVTYMLDTQRATNEPEVRRDDVVCLALEQYMRKNLWTNVTTEEEEPVKLKPVQTPFTSGRKQMRYVDGYYQE